MHEIEVVVITWAEIAAIFAMLMMFVLLGPAALAVFAFMDRFTRIFTVV